MGFPTRTSSVGHGTKLPPAGDDLIPRTDLAEKLDLCPHTLRVWELRGQGPPAIRIGRRVYYRADAVRRWMLDQERSNPTT